MAYNTNQYAGYKPYKGTTKDYTGSRPYKSTPPLSKQAQQYSPQYNEKLQQNVFQSEQNAGISVKKKRSVIDRFFDSLNIGQYPVMNALYNLTDDDPETTALKGAWEGLKSGNPFGKDYTKGERYFSDVLGNAGWNPEDKLGKSAKFAVGLAGDIFLDPTTYFGNIYGVSSKVIKGTGTKVGGVTIKKLTEEIAEKSIKSFAVKGSDEIIQSALNIIKNVGENSKVITHLTNELLQRGTKEAVDAVLSEITTKGYSQIADEVTKQLAERGAGRIAQSATPEAIQALVRRTNKIAGIYDVGESGIGMGFRNMPFAKKLGVQDIHKDFVSEKALREFGDKTIAPLYQKLRHGIGDGIVGKTFDTLSEDGTKLLARTDIEKASKVVLFTDFQKKLTGELAEKNKEVAQFVRNLSHDLSMEDRRKITNYLETSDMFKKRIRNTEVGIAKIKELQDIRESLRTEIFELTKKGNLLGDEKKRYDGLNTIYKKIMEIRTLNTPIHKYMGTEQVDLDVVNKFLHSSVDDIAKELKSSSSKYKGIIDLTDDNVMEQAYMIRKMADDKLESYPEALRPFIRGEEVLPNITFKPETSGVNKALNEITMTSEVPAKVKKEVVKKAVPESKEVPEVLKELGITKEEVVKKATKKTVKKTVANNIEEALSKVPDDKLAKLTNIDGTVKSDDVKRIIKEIEESTGKKFPTQKQIQKLIDKETITDKTVQQKLKRLASIKELSEFDSKLKQTRKSIKNVADEATQFVEEHTQNAQNLYKKALKETPQRPGQTIKSWMDDVKSAEKRLRREVSEGVKEGVFDSVVKKLPDMPPNLYQAKKLKHSEKVKFINDIISNNDMLKVKANFTVNRVDGRNMDKFLKAFYDNDFKAMTDMSHRLHPNYEQAIVLLRKEFGNYAELSDKMKNQRNTRLNELLNAYDEVGITEYTKRFNEQIKLKGKGELAESKRVGNFADVEAERAMAKNPPKEYMGSSSDPLRHVSEEEIISQRKKYMDILNIKKDYDDLTPATQKYVDDFTKKNIQGTFNSKQHAVIPDNGWNTDRGGAKKAIDKVKTLGELDIASQGEYGKNFDKLTKDQISTLSFKNDKFKKLAKKYKDGFEYDAFSTVPQGLTKSIDGTVVKDTFDYKGIKIVKGIEDTNNKGVERVEELTKWIDNLPEKMRNFIADRGIEIRVDDFEAGASGIANYDSSIIHLLHVNKKSASATWLKNYDSIMFPHEVGHFIGRELTKSTRAPKGWNNIRVKDGVEWISGYAKRSANESEDFAESVAYYLSDPTKFIEKFPNRAKVVQDTLNNIKVDEGKIKAMQVAVKQHKQMPTRALDDIRDKLFNDGKNYNGIINDFNSNNISLETAKRKIQETTELLTNKNEFENYMKQNMSTKNYHNTLDLAPVLFDSLDEAENIKGVMKFMRQEFDRMGLKEQDVGLLKTMVDDYVPHILNPDYVPKRTVKDILLGGKGKKFNNHDLMRKLDDTIKNINVSMEEKHKIKKFFLDDIMDIYTARAVKHNELIYDKQYYERLLGTFGGKIDKTNFSLASDMEAVIPVAHVKRFLDMNDKLYDKKTFLKNLGYEEDFFDKTKSGLMKINKDKIEALTRIKEAGFDMFALPQVMYNKANHIGKIQLGNDTKALLGLYDKALHIWKLNVTAVNPGFHIRNFLSNNFQNYLDLGGEAFDSKTQQEALELVKSDKFDVMSTITTRKGKVIRYDDIRKMATDTGVFDKNFFGADLPKVGKKVYNEGDGVKKLLNKINPTDSENFVPYEFGRNVGNKIENHAKLVNFIANLKLGYTPEEASERTMKYLFDYGDLTDFEKQVMKRIIPFYTWARKNIPLQLEEMVEKTHRYTPVAKTLRAVENLTPKEQRSDKSFINDFALDWIQLPGKVKNLDGRDEPLFFNPNLPYGDIDKIPNPFSPKDALRNIASQSSPLLKVPVELAMNKNMFFDSPINRGEGSKKPLPGYMQPSNFIKKQMGKDVDLKTAPPEIRYILDQISSVSNIGEAIEKVGFDRAVHVLNWLGGIKVASYDYEKYKTHALRDRLGNVTKKAGQQR